MQSWKRSNLQSKVKHIDLEFNDICNIQVERDTRLMQIDIDTGELTPIAWTKNGKLRFRCTERDGARVILELADGEHWGVDICSASQKADPVPFEVIDETNKAETLHEKMMRMVGDMAVNMYGPDSREVETLESALDFDLDGDGEIAMSGYEVQDMVDLPPQEAPQAPAASAPSSDAGTVPQEETTPTTPQ